VAQKIQTLFIDDIDGGAAEGTVRFALDGTEYEIDLNAKHSEELRSAIAKYVTHARKVGGGARRAGRTRRAWDAGKLRDRTRSHVAAGGFAGGTLYRRCRLRQPDADRTARAAFRRRASDPKRALSPNALLVVSGRAELGGKLAPDFCANRDDRKHDGSVK